MKTEEIIIGGLLIWFLLSRKSGSAPAAPAKPNVMPPKQTATAQHQRPDSIQSYARCYHAVI